MVQPKVSKDLDTSVLAFYYKAEPQCGQLEHIPQVLTAAEHAQGPAHSLFSFVSFEPIAANIAF